MKLCLRRVQVTKIFVFVLALLVADKAFATVYIYEVTTATSRFHTSSKLAPDTFLLYNGGHDVIYDLKIIAKYADKDKDQAMRDFNLEENNSNMLLHRPIPKRIPYTPKYWWR